MNRANLVVKKNNPNSSIPTPFDYICVIDFEATCDEVNKQNYPHEIIEFPIVLINLKTMLIVCCSILKKSLLLLSQAVNITFKEDCFQKYVKPSINPILTKFCIHLTGITQVPK